MKKIISLLIACALSTQCFGYCLINNTNHTFKLRVYNSHWHFRHTHTVEPFSQYCAMDGLAPEDPVEFRVKDKLMLHGAAGTVGVVALDTLIMIFDPFAPFIPLSKTHVVDTKATAKSNLIVTGFEDSWELHVTPEDWYYHSFDS